MNTNSTATRPETRNNGAATPRVHGFFASRVVAGGIDAVLAALAAGQLSYPLADRCPATSGSEPPLCYLTFLWQDVAGQPPARAVILSANALVDTTDLAAAEFEPVCPGLWAITLKVPADWVASYRITVHSGDGPAPWQSETERRAIRLAADAGGPDPLNPKLAASMNGGPVSVACGPDAELDPHLAEATANQEHTGPAIGGWGATSTDIPTRHPRLSHHVLWDENCQRDRELWMYRPSSELQGDTEQPTPLVIVHDGATWVKYQSIAASLDAAIGAKVLSPVHVLFIDSTNVTLRGQELPVAGGTTLSVATQFLPWARTHFNVSHSAEDTLVTGSSFGGLAALHAVIHHPDLMAKALAQSPSLWHTDLTEELCEIDPRVQLRMQAGRYETVIFDACERTLRMLESREALGRIHFQPVSGGHDWAWWAPRLLSGLKEFFPGKLLEVSDHAAARGDSPR